VLSEPTAVTLKVIKLLERFQIRYLIGGSFASAIHGVARMTAGVDLVVDLNLSDVDPLARELGSEFYVDAEAIRDAVRRRQSFSLIHLATMFKVNIFVFKRRPFDDVQFERRKRYAVSRDPEQHAFVATPEDNILAKLESYRLGGEISDRQWGDVQSVLKTQHGRLDLEYLRHWARELGVADLLEHALEDASA